MSRAAAALFAAALLAAPRALAADDDYAGGVRETALEDESAHGKEVSRVAARLKADPDAAEALTDRIMLSKLALSVSRDADLDRRRAAVRRFVDKERHTAAEIAIGLARDDARGDRHYEETTFKVVMETYARNPNAGGSLGALKETATQSKIVQRAVGNVSEEQQREQLRTLFEGQGGQGDKSIENDPRSKGAPKTTPSSAGPVGTSATTLRDGYYDRLSAANVRGYSPQLVAMQSALNARRPPGAPALVETGKLDHATLAFPGHGMRFDADNLDARFRRDWILALARLSGTTLSEADWKDPDLEKRLAAKVPADKLPARQKRRAEALSRARRAIADFDAAAAKSRDPNAITKGLLLELGDRQREAARWIAVAALEEELARIEAEEGFLSPEALAAVDAVPAPPDIRAAYKKRGEALNARLLGLRANGEAALAVLESDAWQSRLREVERLQADSAMIKKDLSRDIADWKTAPRLVVESLVVQARWRRIAEDLALRYLPRSSFAKSAVARRSRLEAAVAAFRAIAVGDPVSARRALDEIAR